jgi:signal transduction histidine kinase
MSAARHGLGGTTWLHWPRRTARLRLTAAYGALLLLSGAALVAVTYLPTVPRAPALHELERLLPLSGIRLITQAQYQLKHAGSPSEKGFSQPLQIQFELAGVKSRLAQAHQQLVTAQHELARAVHQLARTGSVRAAQRAADSHQLLVNSGIALAIVAVLAVLAGWLVAGRILRPIRTITRTAQRISSSRLHERLALAGPADELKELGDTLDDLFGRLEAAFDAQRHFVANASHELRTPLTAERNLLQVALDDPETSAHAWRSTAREILASNDEQNHLIDSLLTLASSEGGIDRRDPVDLGDVARATLADRKGAVERHGLTVDASIAPAPLDGDVRLVESLVGNLVDNAVTHNIDGGRVDVLTHVEDGRALLAVSNTGPVVPAAEIDRLFQPFQRIDRRRAHYGEGHGLGLSIVRAIAAAHDATVTARPRPGGGLSVEIAFPPPEIALARDSSTTSRPSTGSSGTTGAPVLTG